MGSVVSSLVVPLVVVAGAAPAQAVGFSPGDVVVARVGTGDSALSSAAAAVFLDEYTPAGDLVQSVPLPTTGSGANKRLTMSGSASSEGALALSQDGRYLTLAGYDADLGTASVAGSTVSRVVARVDGAGGVDTSTSVTDSFSGNNVRGAATDDGSKFWVVGANGGVRLANLGASTTTQINSAAPTNIRAVGVSGGQLYVSTGSGTTGVYAVGSGLPTTGGQTPTLTVPAASPYGFVALDRDPTVPGVDTLYVADDSASGGILKFSSDGTTWTARGSFRPSGAGVRGITGQGSTLYATTTTNTLVKVDDSAAFDAPIAGTATVLKTGATNTALRGVAFAPATAPTAPSITTQPQDNTVSTGGTATLTVAANGTGPLSYQWYAGASGDTSNPVATGNTFTTPALTANATYWVRVSNAAGHVDSRTATITVTTAPNTPPTIGPNPVPDLALTLGDPDNPPALRTVDVHDSESSALSITVTSSNSAVATGGATGTGTTRTLTVNPVGVGHATLTVTVSDGDLTASTPFPVSVSGALPAGTHNLYGASDASTAIDLGDGTMVVGDDETNTLRVYDRTHSRYPSQEFDLRAAGLALRDDDVTHEIDIEASARNGNTIYWLGSQGQNSSGKTRLNRQELFTTNVNGTTLALGGSYQHLRDDLVAWDVANGSPLGLQDAATKAPEPDGVNIEGAEFSPDGNTLYLGFRGPLNNGRAIVVPVTNIAALVNANPTTNVSATFDQALLWDLGGRGIREIRKNAANQYLIIAGPNGDGSGFKLYSWDGNPAHQPLLRAGSLDSVAAAGKPEGIVEVPNPLTNASTVQIITDSGDTAWYGDGTAAKDLPLPIRKATTVTVPVGAPPACSTDVVTIGSVQGTTDTSPVVGQTVSVRGTVVGDYEGPQPALRGFYLQDGGDNNPSTSDGIFVFDNSANLVSNGDVVQVTGSVSEFQGQTQITASTSGIESCGRQATVTPTDVTLPRASAGDLEPYEGMLVRFNQTLTVTEHFQLGRFGQVEVSSNGRLRQPTADIRATDQAAVQAAQNANNLNQLIIDDADNSQNPDPIVFGRGGQPLSASNTLRGGDTTTNPVGVLTYTWAGNAASGNAYRLRPVGALGGKTIFDAVNERPTARPDTGTGGVHVASANLLNFFNTFTNCHFGTLGGPTDCRGAQNTTEYQRQLAKEVASLRFMNADVIGYMEMENNGYGSDSAVQALVDALNAADGPGTWAFINPDAATGVTDVAGDDAIKAGMLYKPASVTPVAGQTFVDQNDLYERRPIAQAFTTPTGAKFTVVANHFKSKGSCPTSGPDNDQGDGQGCWNAHRTQQANELVRWIHDTVVPGVGDPDVLIVGDLNSYAGEDPIAALEGAGYTNLVKKFHGNEAYSYVFGGQWGYLDYVLASDSLTPQVTGAGDAHHNADEPSVLDYNTDFKSPGQVQSLYAPDRFRTSDHDPVLAGLNLGVAPTIAGTPPAGKVGSAYSFAYAVGGTSPTVALASGTLPPGVAVSPNGTLSGTPTAAGDFTFTLSATSPFGSASVNGTIHIDPTVTTTVVTSPANPSIVGAPVTFTATVSGNGLAPSGGTVQFTVDGKPLGGPVPVVNGTASATATLDLGRHAVAAAYSGNESFLASAGSLTQVVQYAVKVISPQPGSSFPSGSLVPLKFQLTDANGKPIPTVTAVLLLVSGRVNVSATGSVSLPQLLPLYDPFGSDFFLPLPTIWRHTGPATIKITVTYPGAPTQEVTVPITVR